jgi:hypothetical protein
VFEADAAINANFSSQQIKAIHLAINKAINENSDHHLVLGETRFKAVSPEGHEENGS